MTCTAVLSPTANVRRSCRMLMSDPLVDQYLDEPSDLLSTDTSASSTTAAAATGRRSVGIYNTSLNKLASKIAAQILEESSSPSSESIEWDAEGWHYTAEKYTRSVPSGVVEAQKVERKLLYILALDAINFCFWPTDDESGHKVGTKNLLEYEHLASALRMMAEQDDDVDAVSTSHNDSEDGGRVQAENTYAFSPQCLANLTCESLLSAICSYLPKASCRSEEIYLFPNVSERVRLLNELGCGLLEHHDGSATCMLRKCIRSNGKPSAVKLVDIMTANFRGFRDEAVDCRGRQVAFYKRAQIVVGDIWAAFGRGKIQAKGAELTNFDDIDELTTFADYRVPQLLRHVGVLRYSTELSAKVDSEEELLASSMDELYIRASTVVAVDKLVGVVTAKLQEVGADPKTLDEVNAVLIDWHLWQVGEKLDREGTLKPHHRVRTIFY